MSGTTVLVPARVAAVMLERLDVDGLRTELEEEDREAAEVLASLTAAGRVWSASESFPLPQLTPAAAAGLPQPGISLPLPGSGCARAGDASGSAHEVEPPPVGWVPAKEAAVLRGVPHRTLRHRAQRGLEPAVKVRGEWWLDPEGLAG